MHPCWLATMLLAVSTAFGQTGETAKQVYSSSQDSVFLVYLNDSSGTPSALGSAFLVAPRLLVTNAHVAEAGSPVLAVGPVRIPLKVVRIDQNNDLAILSVDVDLTSKPLPLASGDVSPGEQVFAIGNPEGLEKTISQGIVSGLRKREGRDLLQITSPISHGSSGGPILNAKGEVVGVAVGTLEEGQNLNFAIPVAYVKSLLDQKSISTSAFNVEDSLDEARQLFDKRAKADYSDDSSSEYQQETHQLLDLMETIVSSTGREDALTEVACLGTKATELSDIGIKAARKLLQETPSPVHRALLSYVLYDRAEDESLNSQFAKKDSDEQVKANTAQEQFLLEASHEAIETAKIAKGDTLLIANFVLGGTKSDDGQYTDAISLHSSVTNGKPQICGVDLVEQALRNLISESDSAKRPGDAETWFRRYATLYGPAPFEWDAEGDRRNAAHDPAGAADAYEKAAQNSDYLSYDYCYAASERYIQEPTDSDGVLTDGRKCIDASVTQTGKQGESHFKSEVPEVYKCMADVLELRGVYQSAFEYIKESLAATPDDAFALNTEAKIFSDMERYSECIAAAQAAIRASDGKYPWMHFVLGKCYFNTEDWTNAAASFRITAESDSTDAVSAFDLGLSLSRQGFTVDANHWFHEALNRKPDDELRAKILEALE
jgi:tetratricopeptide (TPR) repeat protein